MTARSKRTIPIELTLLDLVLEVQESTRGDAETVAVVSALLRSGRVRLRGPVGRAALDGADRRRR